MEIAHHPYHQAEYNPDVNQPDKAHFLDRVSREMDEDLGVLDLPPREARMQMRAMAAGGFKEVRPELAIEARDFLLQSSIVRGTFAYWARRCQSINLSAGGNFQ